MKYYNCLFVPFTILHGNENNILVKIESNFLQYTMICDNGFFIFSKIFLFVLIFLPLYKPNT